MRRPHRCAPRLGLLASPITCRAKLLCGFITTPVSDQNRAQACVLFGALFRRTAPALKLTLMWRFFLRGVPGLQRSLRPTARPKNMRRIIARAETAPTSGGSEVRGPSRGSICGDRSIRGVAVARIRGRISACGITNPVKVTEVDGVELSTPATLDCTTAKALKQWVHNGAKPAVGRMGGGIKSLRVVAHYACRTRNNQAGAKISEHARGRAIDIAAINLKDGSSLSLLKDWRSSRKGAVLKRMHKAACGPFGTVLGPNANKYHQDHFHFDTASYRSGSYCR